MIAFDPNGRDAYTSWSETLFSECDGVYNSIALWAHGHDLWERLYGDGGVIEEAHYARSVEELTRHATVDFRRSAGSAQEQRAARFNPQQVARCRYAP